MKLYAYFRQQWSEWFQSGYNWRNFDLIAIQVEDERRFGHYELRLALLGLVAVFNLHLNTDEEAEEEAGEIDRLFEEVTSSLEEGKN